MTLIRLKLRYLAPLLGFCALCLGCALPAPTVPVTPANAAQVSGCQSAAALHNDVTLVDIALGIPGGGLSAVTAADPSLNTSAREGLAIASTVTAVVVAVGAAVVAYASQEYAAGSCSEVVPIPAGGRR